MAEVNPDLVKRLAELVDGDGWETAEVLLEYFPVEEFGEAPTGTNTELYAALDVNADELRRQYGVELKPSTMRDYRTTAIRWPASARAEAASFAAHQKLHGEDRVERMQRYLKRNKGRALSRRDVQRYRADDNPKPPKPWDVAANQRIESLARSLVLGAIVTKRPDWWNAEGVDESRDAVRAMLFDLYQRMGQVA